MDSLSEAAMPKAELFKVMSKPFLGGVDSQRFIADFYFPVHPSAPIRHDGITNEGVKELTANTLHPDRAWFARLGYARDLGSLAVTELRMPLKNSTESPEYYVLSRTDTGRYVSSLVLDKSVFELRNKDTHNPVGSSHDAMGRLIEKTRLRLPDFNVGGAELRVSLIDLQDQATNWRQTEKVTYAQDASSDLTITKSTVILKPGGRPQFTSSIKATDRVIVPSGSHKSEFTVKMSSDDYDIKDPDITSTIYERFSCPATPDEVPGDWVETNTFALKPTDETIQQLARYYDLSLPVKTTAV